MRKFKTITSKTYLKLLYGFAIFFILGNLFIIKSLNDNINSKIDKLAKQEKADAKNNSAPFTYINKIAGYQLQIPKGVRVNQVGQIDKESCVEIVYGVARLFIKLPGDDSPKCVLPIINSYDNVKTYDEHFEIDGYPIYSIRQVVKQMVITPEEGALNAPNNGDYTTLKDYISPDSLIYIGGKYKDKEKDIFLNDRALLIDLLSSIAIDPSESLKGNYPDADKNYVKKYAGYADTLTKDQDGWRIYRDYNCGVTVKVPPIVKPYYHPYDDKVSHPVGELIGSGSFWDVPRGGLSSHFMDAVKIMSMDDDLDFEQLPILYASPFDAGEAISAYVVVNCIPYDLKNGLSVEENIREILTYMNNNLSEFEGQYSLEKFGLTSILQYQKWGVEVYELEIDKPIYIVNPQKRYIVYRNGFLYEIHRSDSTQFLDKTAMQILDKLEFD